MALFDFLGELEKKVELTPPANFWQIKEEEHDIPSTPGVYILIARRGIHFAYPEGKSPIYYIGQTSSLKRRLCGHWKWHDEVKRDKRTVFPLYEARHEYGGEFGGRYCYIKIWRGQTAKGLEDIVLARFAKRYNTFPVANSAAAWNRIKKEFRNAN
jgi:hypothetical protein